MVENITKGYLVGMDLKKLKGRKNVFRVRLGTIQMIFYMKGEDRSIIELG